MIGFHLCRVTECGVDEVQADAVSADCQVGKSAVRYRQPDPDCSGLQ